MASRDLVQAAMWESLCRSFSIPGAAPTLPAFLPAWMVHHLQELYSSANKCLVTQSFTQDGQVTFIRAPVPTAVRSASLSSADTLDRKSKAKVPRPPNVFILYRQHHHPLIKAQFPGIVNNDICKSLPLTVSSPSLTTI